MANITTASVTIDDGVITWDDMTIDGTLSATSVVADGLTMNLTQDYTFLTRGSTLAIQSQTDDTQSALELFSKKGDTGDDVLMETYGRGIPSSFGTREMMQMGYKASGTKYIVNVGTTNGTVRPFEIQENGTAWLSKAVSGSITLTGNVGIGVATPQKTLHVHEATSSTSNYIRISNDATGSGANDGTDFGLGATGNIVLWNKENTAFHLATNNIERFHITAAGNVGIGETAPANLLHVKASDTGIAPHGSAQIVLEREGTNYLQFLTAEAGTSGILFGDGSDVDVGKIYYDHNVPSMYLMTETAIAMTINASQNVGIGTTTPFTNVAGGSLDLSVDGAHIKGSSHAQLLIEGSPPSLNMIDTGGGSNDKWMLYRVDGGVGFFISINDSGSTLADNILVMDLGTGNVGTGAAPSATYKLLATYDASRYAGLAGSNGTAGTFYRNTSGDSQPVVNIFQDNASNAYEALQVTQHGTGYAVDIEGPTVSGWDEIVRVNNAGYANGRVVLGQYSGEGEARIYGSDNVARVELASYSSTSEANVEIRGTDDDTNLAFRIKNNSGTAKFSLDNYGQLASNPYVTWGGGGVAIAGAAGKMTLAETGTTHGIQITGTKTGGSTGVRLDETWTGGHQFFGFYANITNTSSASSSSLFRGSVGGTVMFDTTTDGAMFLGRYMSIRGDAAVGNASSSWPMRLQADTNNHSHIKSYNSMYIYSGGDGAGDIKLIPTGGSVIIEGGPLYFYDDDGLVDASSSYPLILSNDGNHTQISHYKDLNIKGINAYSEVGIEFAAPTQALQVTGGIQAHSYAVTDARTTYRSTGSVYGYIFRAADDSGTYPFNSTGNAAIVFQGPSSGGGGDFAWATGNSSPTVKMVLSKEGTLVINNLDASSSGNTKLWVHHDVDSSALANNAVAVFASKADGRDANIQISDTSTYSIIGHNSGDTYFYHSTTGLAFRVLQNGNVQSATNSYGSTSDERIKQNIVNANSQWNDIKALKFKNFKKKADVLIHGETDAPLHLGIIAQELEATSPNLVYEINADAKDDGKLHDDFKVEGATVKGIKYSVLFMKATKALQEAMARIEVLETEVEALKASE